MKYVLAILLGALAMGPVWAACPAEVTGTTAEAIAVNSQRLLCLQRETSEMFRQRKLDVDLMTLERSVQNMQLQRRFDTLPTIQPYFP